MHGHRAAGADPFARVTDIPGHTAFSHEPELKRAEKQADHAAHRGVVWPPSQAR